MAIEIVEFPIKNGDFPVRYVKLSGNRHNLQPASLQSWLSTAGWATMEKSGWVPWDDP